MLDSLEPAAGATPPAEESAAERAARVPLTAEHVAAAQELLRHVRAVHLRYTNLIAAAGRLPLPEERHGAIERLKVVSGPVSVTLAGITTLLRGFDLAQAAAAASAPKKRKRASRGAATATSRSLSRLISTGKRRWRARR